MPLQKSHDSINITVNSLSSDHQETKDQRSGFMFGPQVKDAEIDGLDIVEAASSLGIGVEDIWRRIRNGQLIARSHLGQVYVYTDPAKYQDSLNLYSNDQLPPVPNSDVEPLGLEDESFALTQIYQSNSDSEALEIASSRHDLAVVLNHLSLAKEENREILRFTTDSMTRLSQMTDSMLKMKDEVIQARESQVQELATQIAQKTDELRRLAKENENLSTVAKFLEG